MSEFELSLQISTQRYREELTLLYNKYLCGKIIKYSTYESLNTISGGNRYTTICKIMSIKNNKARLKVMKGQYSPYVEGAVLELKLENILENIKFYDTPVIEEQIKGFRYEIQGEV